MMTREIVRRYCGAVLVPPVILAALLYGGRPLWAMQDSEMAVIMVEKLGAEFKPESVSVRVSGNHAFAEAHGVYLSGVRIDRLNIEAILTGSEIPDGGADSLASIISYSWGEVELLASDINEYFKTNETRGFSGLSVRFSPDGFKAEGVFVKSLLFTFRIRLSATGKFGLRPDGLYIEDPSIYVENLRQPDFLVKEMLDRANPLIKWSEIPFKVVFKEITMTDHSAVMTGGPRDFSGGALAVWNADGRRAFEQ